MLLNLHFVHFFVSADILFQNADEFETLKQQTTVLSAGPATNIEKTGFRLLDCSLPEEEIYRQLKHLQNTGRYEARDNDQGSDVYDILSRLSNREKDVLRLIVKGRLNKEVADELNISLATAIFHRNNISLKLNTRSIGRLTIYAVLNNIVALSEI